MFILITSHFTNLVNKYEKEICKRDIQLILTFFDWINFRLNIIS